MDFGDHLQVSITTAEQMRSAIKRKHGRFISNILIVLQYLWHNLCPKIRFTRPMYFLISGERHRMYSRTEALGRLCRAGFHILSERDTPNALYIEVEKKSEPLERNETCVSPILRLRRIGKDGKLIDVHKFRTMHSYSQYLQEYVYEHNNLREGGKLANDFRVNIWGKLLRPLWLDELPMLWDLLRGDLKLVGVRPLSEHYFSLYSTEMQQLRTRVKPGLIPPFYYESETPKDLDAIQASERRYIEAYLRHPHLTDLRYFWGTIANILIRRKRSH